MRDPLPVSALRHAPLHRPTGTYLTLGTELRLRYERIEDNGWGEGPQDRDGYLWLRALPLVDLHVGEDLRAFVQLVSASVIDLDVPPSPVDEDRLDVLQGFVDLALPLGGERRLTLRAGRQLLAYGSGRLIDVRYGPNVLQAFDAARAWVVVDGWQVDALYARPVDHRPGVLDDVPDPTASIWALYAAHDADGGPFGLDAYVLGLSRHDAVFAERTGHELRHTLGARVFGEAAGWTWDVELFAQVGTFDTPGERGRILAGSVASHGSHTLGRVPLRPRLGLRMT